MPGDCRHTQTSGEPRGGEITHYYLRQHAASSPAAVAKMAPPRVNLAAVAAVTTSKQLPQSGAPGTGEAAKQVNRPLSPIISPALPCLKSQPDTGHTLGMDGRPGVAFREIVADLPTKQHLQAMATSIVNALSWKLHEIHQQVDIVEDWVTELESSSASTDIHLTALDSDHQTIRRYLIDVQLWLDNGEHRSRCNNLRLHGIPEATMGPDPRATVVAILNQLLGKPPTAKLELHRVHRVPGPRHTHLSPQGQALPNLPQDVFCRVHFFVVKEPRGQLTLMVLLSGSILCPGKCRAMRGLLRPSSK